MFSAIGIYTYTRSATPAYAAPATTLNFQARLLNGTGSVVPDGTYDIVFNLYEDSTGGSTLWTETWNSGTSQVTLKGGYLSVYLGTHTSFPALDWSDDKFLTMNVNADGEMSPRLKLTAVPFAFNSQQLEGRGADEFVQLDPGASAQNVNTANSAINILQAGNGTVLNLASSGTGNLAVLDTTNATANGVSIDVQSNTTSQYALRVTTNNGATNALYVRADGSVGIGTTNPGQALEVVGNIKLGDGNDRSIVGPLNHSLIINGRPNDPNEGVLLQVNGGNALAVVQGGNVGVGTITPTLQLQVQSASHAQVGIVAGDTSESRLYFGKTSNLYRGAIVYDHNVDTLQFNTGGQPRLVLSNSGLRTPDASLPSTASANTNIFTGNGTSTNNTSGNLNLYTGTATGTGLQGTVNVQTTSGNTVIGNAAGASSVNINAGTGNLAVNTSQLVVQSSNGNVGIGTTGPDRKLDVLDASNPQLRLTNVDNTTFTDLQTDTNGYLRVTPSGGRVGINYAASPQASLDVAGDFILRSAGSPEVKGYRSLGSVTAPTAVDHNNILLALRGFGYDGASFQQGAEILFSADTGGSNWSGADRGSRITFATTEQGTTTQSERVRIDHNGNVGIGTTNPTEKLHVEGGNILATPGAPTAAGSLDDVADGPIELFEANQVKVVGDYAYVTAYADDGISIINIADPNNPILISTVVDGGSILLDGPEQIDIVGNYAYVAVSNDSALEILDISDPSAVTHVGSYINATYLDGTGGVEVVGRYAYMTSFDDNSFVILDISDPTNISLVGQIQAADELVGAYDVDIRGNYAYVAAFRRDNPTTGTGAVQIIDISNPASPSIVSTVTNAGANITSPWNLEVRGSYMYVAGHDDNAISIIDISDPTTPVEVGSLVDATNMYRPAAIKIAGNYAYVAKDGTTNTGVAVVDISDPTNPTFVAQIVDDGSTELEGAWSLDVIGNYAYVTGFDDDGFQVLNLSGGIIASQASIGSLKVTNIYVDQNITVNQSISVTNGLNVGVGGVQTQGRLSVQSAAYIGGSLNIGQIDATGELLVVDTKTTAGDPTGTNGAIYYNSDAGKFRCYEAGAWADCLGSGGGYWTASGSDIYYDSGFVGIGAAPSSLYRLDIQGVGTVGEAKNARLRLQRSDDTGLSTVEFAGSGAASVANPWYQFGLDSTASFLSLYVDDGASGYDPLRIETDGDVSLGNGNLFVGYSTGRVGIGTSNLDGQLTVDTDPGEGRVGLIIKQQDNTSNPTALEIQNAGTGNSIQVGTNTFVVDGNGEVGIGNATPTALLDLYRTANADVDIRLDNPNTGPNAYASLRLQTDTGDFYLGVGSEASALSGNFGIFAGGQYRLLVEDGGDIGIGVNNATGRLHVLSAGTSSDIGRFDASTGSSRLLIRQDSNDQVLLRHYDTANVETNRISPYSASWINGGNVGIGTDSPQSRLHVVQNGTAGTPSINSVTTAVFQRSSGAGAASWVSVISGNTGVGRLNFGDTDSETRGGLEYDNATDDMNIRLAGGNRLTLANNRNHYFDNGNDHSLFVETRSATGTGRDFTLRAGHAYGGGAAGAGGPLALQGGNAAGTGNASGGPVNISGGAGVGTGAYGNVILQQNGGNVAVGSTNASYRLEVTDSQATSYAARIHNSNTGTGADGLLISLGVANASRTTGNYFVGFSDGAGTVAGKIQGGANAVAYTTTGADYAEYFRDANLTKRVSAGYIGALSSSANKSVKRAVAGQPLVGVGSSNPGFIGNGPLCLASDNNCDANYAQTNALIGLSGQVKTLVTNQNGAILPGDPITVSATTPGIGVKATASTYVVGYAMEGYNSTSAGKILIYINPGYWAPSTQDTLQAQTANFGDLQVIGTASIASLNVTGNASLQNLTVLADATIEGTLTVANVVVAGNIVVEGKIISRGDSPTVADFAVLGLATEGANVAIEGTDTAGTITLTTGDNPEEIVEGVESTLSEVVFNSAYQVAPRIALTAKNGKSTRLPVYVRATNDGFKLLLDAPLAANTTYQFDYIIIASKSVATP